MQKVKQFAIEKKELCIRAGAALAVVVALVSMLAIAVFGETTYVINDGERTVIHKTEETDIAAVLGEAELPLAAGDLYEVEDGLFRSTISIRRAVDMHIDYYGEAMDVYAYEDETLNDVLVRLGLTWTEADTLSMSLDTMVVPGISLDISTIVVEEQTYTVAVPYETVNVDDDDMKKGKTKVKTAGVEGEKVCVDKVTYVNGVETARELVSEEVTLEPVNEVVAVGTGKNLVTKYSSGVIVGDDTITLPSGEVLTYTKAKTFKATAYTHTDAGCNKTTATGTTVRWGTVAVDPRVIPYGTRMFIMTTDGSFIYGIATAEDCGGAIKNDRIDLYMPTYSQCIQFGRRNCTVFFIG